MSAGYGEAIQTPAFKFWRSLSMNGDFSTAEVIKVGTFQVAEVPENRYDYTLPQKLYYASASKKVFASQFSLFTFFFSVLTM